MEKKYGIQNDAKYFSTNHDYILVYAKNITSYSQNLLPRTEEQDSRYTNRDNDPRGVWKSADLSVGRITEKDRYEIITPSGRRVTPPEGRSWVVGKEAFELLVQDNRIWFGADGNNVPSVKKFLSEVKDGRTASTIWEYDEVGHTDKAKKEVKNLFDGASYFDYPKPVDLIKQICILTTDEDSIVLDFFSGSATTAHSVLKVNVADNGNRKFIMVQIPEKTMNNSSALEDSYNTICEIGKERIRRAGDKLLEENKDTEGIENLDTGFKVFKLDSSNIKKWDANNQNLEDYLNFMVYNFVEGRNEEDVLYEIMLKYGIDLTAPIESRSIAGKNVYSIGFGALFVCLDMEITIDVVEGIVAYKDELEPARTSIIFRDNGFKDSTVKTNALQILRTNDIEEVMSI